MQVEPAQCTHWSRIASALDHVPWWPVSVLPRATGGVGSIVGRAVLVGGGTAVTAPVVFEVCELTSLSRGGCELDHEDRVAEIPCLDACSWFRSLLEIAAHDGLQPSHW